MNDVLNRIFEEVVLTDSDTISENIKMDTMIKAVIEEYVANRKGEELLDLCASVARISERTGFYLGFKYAVKIMCSIL